MLDLDKVKDLMCRIDEKYRRCSTLIVEGVETKNMKAAKHYLYQNKNCNEKQAMQIIGAIKTDVPNVRNAKCKFILALTRMYCEGQLSDGKVIRDINTALKYITSNAHVNEYDQNLNGLSAKEIIDRFSGVAQQDLEQDKAYLERQDFTQSNNTNRYEIVKITSFEEAEEYGEYTDWCVTHDEDMLDSYTSGDGVFYFSIRNDYKEVEKKRGEGCPLDDYGLSMIATSVNSDGSCNTITCRWNHDNGGNDHIMTPEELSRVVGCNYYKTFLPLTPEEIEWKKKELLWAIDDELSEELAYEEVDGFAKELTTYDRDYDDFVEDEVPVYRFSSRWRDKCVLIDAEGNRISDEVFDSIGDRYGNYVEVETWINNQSKYNYIDISTGRLMFDTWFDYSKNYFDNDGYAIVGIENKGWTIFSAKNGALADEWFEVLSPLSIPIPGKEYGFTRNRVLVLKNNKYNILNPHDVANPIFPEWFYDYRSLRTQEGKVLYAFRYDNVLRIQDLVDGKKIIPYDFTELKITEQYEPVIKLTNGQWYTINNDFSLSKYNG